MLNCAVILERSCTESGFQCYQMLASGSSETGQGVCPEHSETGGLKAKLRTDTGHIRPTQENVRKSETPRAWSTVKYVCMMCDKLLLLVAYIATAMSSVTAHANTPLDEEYRIVAGTRAAPSNTTRVAGISCTNYPITYPSST